MPKSPHPDSSPPAFINKARLPVRQIPGFQAHALLFAPETGSTNDDLKVIARQKPFTPVILITGHQRAGRGQNTNRWLDLPPSSPYKLNSFLCSFHWNTPDVAFPLSLIAGLAVLQGILREGGEQPGLWLKWPNDLMLGSTKVGGLLLESLAQSETSLLIVGIGINFTPPPMIFLGKPSAGLGPFDADQRFAGLLVAILSAWSRLIHDSPAVWRSLFLEYSRPFWNRRIEYGPTNQRRTAVTIDLNPDGSLLVFDEQEKGRCNLHSALGIRFLDEEPSTAFKTSL